MRRRGQERTRENKGQEMRGEVRVIRCANYTAVCENGSISAITATNNVNYCPAKPYNDGAYSTLFFAAAFGGILQTADRRVVAPDFAGGQFSPKVASQPSCRSLPTTFNAWITNPASGWASALRVQPSVSSPLCPALCVQSPAILRTSRNYPIH